MDVELFSAGELDKQLIDPLRRYRNYHLKSDDTTKDKLDNKNEAEETEKVFALMFGARLHDKTFLLNDSEQDVIAALSS